VNAADIIITLILVFGAFSGFRQGLILGLVSLSGILISILAAVYFMNVGSRWLVEVFLDLGPLTPIFVFIGIFIAAYIILIVIGRVLKKIIRLSPLGILDQLGGSIFGLVKSVLLLCLFVWLIESFNPEFVKDKTANSLLYPRIEATSHVIIFYGELYFPLIKNFILNFDLSTSS
jgi:membrane protein required for colicin V production